MVPNSEITDVFSIDDAQFNDGLQELIDKGYIIKNSMDRDKFIFKELI